MIRASRHPQTVLAVVSGPQRAVWGAAALGAVARYVTVCILALLEIRAMGVELSATAALAGEKPRQDLDFSDPARLPAAPADAPGFPSRAADLDILPGFRRPPPGYGQVPFWWWTGDPLDRERLLWQIEELHRQGVTGMQVNYAHEDTPGWPTYAAQPEVFSDAWWEVWKWVVAESRQRGMGIGLSGYTLDWPGKATNLFGRLLYGDPETQGQELTVVQRLRADSGTPLSAAVPADAIAVRAYSLDGETPRRGGTDLSAQVRNGRLAWTPPAGVWDVWIVAACRRPLTLNPLHPESGRRVVERFFQPCQDRAPSGGAAGLNYFFQDELQFGVAGRLWCADFAEQFRQRQGYDLLEVLPALFAEMGPLTAKARLDYADVKVQLTEERYFRPIFDWHWSRGLIYACDPGSRGRNPEEFGDYFRCVRWYTAPGHDTPGGNADLIKGKVSSSMAHLYQRPRVWLEGYHSLGWGATPARLLQATCENYAYGCTLLNLHGLYYTTHGSFWEWAPPCYFRMPYWEHMGLFMKYFERLSYVLSQGVHCCEVAVVYPVAPYDAGLGGKEAADVAFTAGQALVGGGLDFDFIDFQSLARAESRNGRLYVAGESYSVLVLPALRAVRWSTLEKACELYRAGGTVIGLAALPEASDRVGGEDRELDARVKELFGATAAEARAGARPPPQRSAAAGRGVALLSLGEPPPRQYEGGFSGRWVWAKEAVPEVRFKGVWRGPAGIPETCPVRFFCDNAGALYINDRLLCERVDYRSGWVGEAILRDGDVITVEAHDDDDGNHSAGMFLAILRAGQTVFSAADLRYAQGRPTAAAWRTSPDLAGLAVPDTLNVHELHRGRADGTAGALLAALGQVPREVVSETPCLALHRRAGPRDVYLVTGAAAGSECVFRSRGRVEWWDPWTGQVRPLLVTAETPGGTRVRLPLAADAAHLIVFSPGAVPARVTATSLAEVTDVRATAAGTATVIGYVTGGGRHTAEAEVAGRRIRVAGTVPALPPPMALDGPWEFELVPTLDNRWGDFRLPATPGRIGPEARLYRYAEEQAPDPGWQRADVDDAAWALVTCGFGQQFWKLGPLPADDAAGALDARLAGLARIDPAAPLEVGGQSYTWQPYAFSWRWGVEGDPGHQGWHGLKESITDDFICLGAPKEGQNETLYAAEPVGRRYYLWTTVPAVEAVDVALRMGGVAPAAVYIGGARVERPEAPLRLSAGANPLLLRYDTPGRSHVVLERLGAGAPARRTPLAMSWYDLPGRMAFDVRPGVAAPAGWYRFRAPPGLAGMTVTARGELQAWADGQPLAVTVRRRQPDGSIEYGVTLAAPIPGLARVALRLGQERGCYGGAGLPEPIALDCRPGLMSAGDWSQGSALECYSGGAWYRKTITLTAVQLSGRLLLDLGAVAATAEVRVNGSTVGVRVAPPWVVDIGPQARVGDNRIEVLVYNTLANHYRTIPTRYRGSARSGLLGPVGLETRPRVELSEVQ